MPVEIARDTRAWSLTLSGAVDVREAPELYVAALEVAAAESGDVVVRLDAVEALDTATTQVLLALRRAVIGAGRGFCLADVPAAIAAWWAAAGLADELMPAGAEPVDAT